MPPQGGVPWPPPAPPDPGRREYSRILVIKMSALGDIVHALPSLYALRSLFPEAEVDWVVEPRFAGLLPGPPWIDRLALFRKSEIKALPLAGKLAALRDFRRELKGRRYELVLDLQGLMKSTLVALLSGGGRRLGYCEMREGSFLFTRAVKGRFRKGHVIQRYLDVVRSLGPIPDEIRFPLPDCSREREDVRRELLALGAAGPLAVLFPGAGWGSKLWPAASYAALARALAREGLSVAVGGGAADGGLAREIAGLAGGLRTADLTGRTDLGRLMGLASLAAVCVGSDTGPLHLAAALGTPTVSLFGPSSGERAGTWGPLARYVATDAPCSPCFKRRCPRKEFVCMGRISPDAALAACRTVLSLAPPKSL